MAVDPLSPEGRRIAERIRALARLMDASFKIPGTGVRFGLDPILGLLPGLGDAAAAAVAGYLLLEARRLGVPRRIMARMLANVLADMAVGAVPIAGDAFDLLFRANLRNARLLEDWLIEERARRGRSSV